MTYELVLSGEAERHLRQRKKSGQTKILAKIAKLLEELRLHPTTGTGQVEQLKGELSGYWSRRIDKSSRMVYRIEDARVIVIVVSMKGHYGDK